MEERDFDRCMERIRQGDKEGLKEIYLAYGSYIFHLILGVLQNRENAEDVTSEFFIKLWDLGEKYIPGSGHRAWLSRIARNMAIDFIRANKREVLSDLEQEEWENAMEGQDETEEEALSNVTIEEALSRLKPGQREVVHLKIVGDLTFEEISGLLQVPMGTVTWRYREAIKILRRCGYEA